MWCVNSIYMVYSQSPARSSLIIGYGVCLPTPTRSAVHTMLEYTSLICPESPIPPPNSTLDSGYGLGRLIRHTDLGYTHMTRDTREDMPVTRSALPAGT
jgi:hypothetical protein